jgi:hypothetical protein
MSGITRVLSLMIGQLFFFEPFLFFQSFKFFNFLKIVGKELIRTMMEKTLLFSQTHKFGQELLLLFLY